MSDAGATEAAWTRWSATHPHVLTADDVTRARLHVAFAAGVQAGLELAQRRAHPPEPA